VRRRIKQLIHNANNPTPIPRRAPQRITMTRELALEIKADVLARRTLTYEGAGELLGCSAEKMRMDARGYPIIKSGKVHRIPECVFKLIVRDLAVVAMDVAPEAEMAVPEE
jgi:hypothetical protein